MRKIYRDAVSILTIFLLVACAKNNIELDKPSTSATNAIGRAFQANLLADGFTATAAQSLASTITGTSAGASTGVALEDAANTTVVGAAGTSGAQLLMSALSDTKLSLTSSERLKASADFMLAFSATESRYGSTDATKLATDVSQVVLTMVSNSSGRIATEDIPNLIGALLAAPLSTLPSSGVTTSTLAMQVLPQALGVLPQALSNAQVPSAVVASLLSSGISAFTANGIAAGASAADLASGVADGLGKMATSLDQVGDASALADFFKNGKAALLQGLSADDANTAATTFSNKAEGAMKAAGATDSNAHSAASSVSSFDPTRSATPTITVTLPSAQTQSSSKGRLIVSAYHTPESTTYMVIVSYAGDPRKLSTPCSVSVTASNGSEVSVSLPLQLPWPIGDASTIVAGAQYRLQAFCGDVASETVPWTAGGTTKGCGTDEHSEFGRCVKKPGIPTPTPTPTPTSQPSTLAVTAFNSVSMMIVYTGDLAHVPPEPCTVTVTAPSGAEGHFTTALQLPTPLYYAMTIVTGTQYKVRATCGNLTSPIVNWTGSGN